MSTQSARETWNRTQLKHFETMLENRRLFLMSDVQGLEREEAQTAGGTSGLSIHSADLGMDRSAHDVSLGCMQSATSEIQEIDEALDRIRQGNFGICESCERKISKERLGAIPYARLCLSCKKDEEAA